MTETVCWACQTAIDVQADAWWRYSWQEEPSEEDVEKAIEDPDFGDWFTENKVVCVDCHELLQREIRKVRDSVR